MTQIVATHFKTSPDTLRLDTRLREDLGGDSLDLVELVFDLEQSLDVTVAEGAVADLETLGDAVRYMQTLSR
ncbi:MAG: acyl carrier protein [Candidatus Rokubacteria bacterium]|nr:acyl carrier protein [Candidatus Rokubacteria bacterium]